MKNQTDIPDFDGVYKQYNKSIYNFVYSMLGRADEAEDMTQETFMALHHQLEQQPELGNVRGWLYRVASNLCLNHLKRHKHYRQILTQNKELHNDVDAGTPEKQMLAQEQRQQQQRRVRDAMQRLPKREQVLLLLYRDQLSYAEMADITGIRSASIGKLLSRAREKLVQEIRSHQHDTT